MPSFLPIPAAATRRSQREAVKTMLSGNDGGRRVKSCEPNALQLMTLF